MFLRRFARVCICYHRRTDMKYPNQSAELIKLLAQDQAEWKAYAKAEYADKLPADELRLLKVDLRKRVTERGIRVLQILDEVGGWPSLSNIESEAAIALSVLATHYSLDATKQVLEAFEACYIESPENTQATSIPAMTDWVAILEGKPQKFGTIWLFDNNNYPFLPTVKNFANINERRTAYGIAPLRWPKSMAIPEKDQPWLGQPIGGATMRAPTTDELQKLTEFY
jgi:hypothetical protein